MVRAASDSLVLHCGGRRVERDQLRRLKLPVAQSDTHRPIPHFELVRQTVEQLEAFGVKVATEAHGLSAEDQRYFGVFGLSGGRDEDGYGLVIGLRNSHDQTYVAGLALGTRVFVCDNLAFSGEVTIARKHTRHILRDLPGLMTSAVGKIVASRVSMEKRVLTYKETEFTDMQAHDLIVRAIDSKVISPPKIAQVLGEWRNPSHEEFEARTAWSLFNAFTETLKGYTEHSMYERSQPLHGVFDMACGLNLATAV